MRITVISRLGNPVENAKVTVFQNRDDYENEENAIAGPAFTDAKGRVTFKNLEEKQYFVQVIKGDANNYGDAEQTAKLIKGKVNKPGNQLTCLGSRNLLIPIVIPWWPARGCAR